jgi:hypothetical protein
MKETLEDAKQRILDSNYMTLNDADIFEMGTKWQSERMYTEEEVIAFAKWMYDYKADINKVEEWLEQFKKK